MTNTVEFPLAVADDPPDECPECGGKVVDCELTDMVVGRMKPGDEVHVHYPNHEGNVTWMCENGHCWTEVAEVLCWCEEEVPERPDDYRFGDVLRKGGSNDTQANTDQG